MNSQNAQNEPKIHPGLQTNSFTSHVGQSPLQSHFLARRSYYTHGYRSLEHWDGYYERDSNYENYGYGYGYGCDYGYNYVSWPYHQREVGYFVNPDYLARTREVSQSRIPHDSIRRRTSETPTQTPTRTHSAHFLCSGSKTPYFDDEDDKASEGAECDAEMAITRNAAKSTRARRLRSTSSLFEKAPKREKVGVNKWGEGEGVVGSEGVGRKRGWDGDGGLRKRVKVRDDDVDMDANVDGDVWGKNKDRKGNEEDDDDDAEPAVSGSGIAKWEFGTDEVIVVCSDDGHNDYNDNDGDETGHKEKNVDKEKKGQVKPLLRGLRRSPRNRITKPATTTGVSGARFLPFGNMSAVQSVEYKEMDVLENKNNTNHAKHVLSRTPKEAELEARLYELESALAKQHGTISDLEQNLHANELKYENELNTLRAAHAAQERASEAEIQRLQTRLEAETQKLKTLTTEYEIQTKGSKDAIQDLENRLEDQNIKFKNSQAQQRPSPSPVLVSVSTQTAPHTPPFIPPLQQQQQQHPSLTPTSSPPPPPISTSPPTDEETRTNNVRKHYIRAKMKGERLRAAAKKMVDATRGMDLVCFGEFGRGVGDVRRVLDEWEGGNGERDRGEMEREKG